MALPPVVATLLADTKEYSAKMDEATGKMERLGAASETTGSKMSAFAGKAATAVLGLGVAVVGVSVDLAMKYSEALDTMQRSTNLTAGQVDYLRGKILDVSTATATSATTIVSGETQLIKSGESLKQSLHDVGQAAKYSQATGADLNTTLTAAIGIQRMHIAGTSNMTETLNIFDTAVKNSQLSSSNLTAALGGKALSAFSAYHIDLKSAVTLLAGFADQNLVGTKATMALKTGIAALEKPTTSTTGKITTAALAVKSVGLNMNTLAAEVRKPGGAIQVMQQLSTAFNENASSGMKAKGMAAWLQQIFGSSAGPAFANMIAELPKLQTLYDKLNTSGGAVNTSFADWLKSPAGAVAKFKTVLENTAIRLGDVLLPKLTVGLIDATKIITGVLGSPTGSSLAIGGAEALIGGAIVTKLVRAMITAAEGLGMGGAAGIGAAEASGVAAGAGAVTMAGIASFIGTTEILKHNLFGLGTAVNNAAGNIAKAFGINLTRSGTTQESGSLAAVLKSYGITPGMSTVGLSPATIKWMEEQANKGRATSRHGAPRPGTKRTTVRVAVRP
jgi:TP901 family phage tail tape measure protein